MRSGDSVADNMKFNVSAMRTSPPGHCISFRASLLLVNRSLERGTESRNIVRRKQNQAEYFSF